MGVKGLWSLLNPVSRPVQIESMEGKRLAIDSSIWLYQFQATMRDKDGRVLVNAHVLGFLRRINKLLFNGIKPVFVFDGGAPALKRSTIAERKKKKSGAAASHAKVAEKLFAAQMRREAVKAAQVAQEQKEAQDAANAAAEYSRLYPDEAGEQISVNAIYLEELEGRPRSSVTTPAPPRNPAEPSEPGGVPTDPEKRRKYFKKHDPYRLPEVAMPEYSTSDKPDARLATEAELSQFIDDVNPEDIDIESAEFRALPTEVQYEIIGDLRVRSRQQSHRRLADMLRSSTTALDFSKSQIKQLSQRNALTQHLLTVTDMVGKAHLTIPVRIASERNREYVLVKRGEDEGGGWALGIREGSKEKPIEVEPDEPKVEDPDFDVELASRPRQGQVDDDFRQHRRREVLEAIAARYAPKRPKRQLDMPIKPFGAARSLKSKPLFDTAEEEDEWKEITPTSNDEALALALQQEELGDDETEADEYLARALALSRREAERRSRSESEDVMRVGAEEISEEEENDDMEEVDLVPSGTTTPLPVVMPSVPVPFEEQDTEDEDDFEEVDTAPSLSRSASLVYTGTMPQESDGISRIRQSLEAPRSEPIVIDDDDDEEPLFPKPIEAVTVAKSPHPVTSFVSAKKAPASSHSSQPPIYTKSTTTLAKPSPLRNASNDSSPSAPYTTEDVTERRPMMDRRESSLESPISAPPPRTLQELDEYRVLKSPSPRVDNASYIPTGYVTESDGESQDEDLIDDSRSNLSWSRSPTPPLRPLQHADSTLSMASAASAGPSEIMPRDDDEDDGDMAPADVAAESDDYARFVASIKGRNLEEVRGEIDDEIRVLNAENRVAMRDSDEITQSMVGQIQTMLRHFGIPYITAPMEAEAQCAKLAELGLVDGIITDDSDVFLFGGIQCYKNIFNDAKYAECFLLSDIERELMLSRDRLISLAFFLGSDYTIGLPGVGPVMGLEILANFPGDGGLQHFREWWGRVQRGVDSAEESGTKWRKSFKKRFAKSIYLDASWPDPLVREAYKYPTVDESEEPFHWGFPKLSSLRIFLHEELSWSISKVDDELTPIVQRIALRGKQGALKKQATLDPFFDLSAGSSYYAPRRKGVQVSKRLMGVIRQFKEAEMLARGDLEGLDDDDDLFVAKDEEEVIEAVRNKGKRKVAEVERDSEEQGEKKKSSRGRKRTATVSSVADSTSGSSRGSSRSARGEARQGAKRGRRGKGRVL